MIMAVLTFAVSPWLANQALASDRVRRIGVQGDQIVSVKTALGIATIIQVPDTPNSVVVGDQSAFKVEYLDRAITIKPLSMNAKSNLYIYTDWKRYNVQLVTNTTDAADYVVYLESGKKPEPKKTPDRKWTSFMGHTKNGNLTLSVRRLGRPVSDTVLLEFKVETVRREVFQPEILWITQEGVTKPIQNLILSHLEATPSRPITGLVELKVKDLSTNLPIRLEVRREKRSFVTIPEVRSWK
jgi:hypothetical protein